MFSEKKIHLHFILCFHTEISQIAESFFLEDKDFISYTVNPMVADN